MFSLKYPLDIMSSLHHDSQNTAHLTLWSTCGRSSGGTYREWEGTVCLGVGQSSHKVRFEFKNVVSVCEL